MIAPAGPPAPAGTGTIILAMVPSAHMAPPGEPVAAISGGAFGRPPSPSSPPLSQDDVVDAAAFASYPSPNPLVAAAAPLLMALGNLRALPVRIEPTELAGRLANLIQRFNDRIAVSSVSEADARIAVFALCETCDDIVPTLPGIDRDAWLQIGMLSQLFRTTTAGRGFFDALNKMLATPEAHQPLLELMYACLSLGFEGQYRGMDRREGLERVRRDVYDTLRYFKPRPSELSPHWTPSPATVQHERRLPLWAVAAAAVALVTGAFFGMRSVITDRGEALAGELLTLAPSAPAAIQRASFVPFTEDVKPPEVVQQRIALIRAALAKEIALDVLTVEAKGDFIQIEIGSQLLFKSGQAKADPSFDPVATTIAAALDTQSGAIRIIGHTDNIKPSKSSAFKSNYDLSLARAEAVRSAIAPKLGDAARVSVEGKGEDEPVADNANPDDRARNRRVDILIPKEEAPSPLEVRIERTGGQ
ncbi:type VI secretion system protein TssL, long form [Mesorhizobium sp. BR1-1-16]|nr:type VI secretion system protein TssL, long form [Mesorhizobium sp. BR1-1-16]